MKSCVNIISIKFISCYVTLHFVSFRRPLTTRWRHLVPRLRICFTCHVTYAGSCFPVSPRSMRMEQNSPATGSLAGRVVLPCHFSIMSVSTMPTTPPPAPGPLLLSDALHAIPSPGEELRIKWTKLVAGGEKVVLVAQGGVVKVGQDYKSRVSVASHPLSVGDASLLMVQLRASDAGLYRCEVMHGMEDTQDTVSLNVTG